jgi:signal transduction histidine kinase/iron only hydrogenase large subunit-like protein
MAVVFTLKERCKRCYACVRGCPVRAIKVREGRAEIIHDQCISCGTCIRLCAQEAKQYENSIGIVWDLLGNHEVIAVLDPASPAAFDFHIEQLVTSLKRMGFAEVMEAAFGAEMVAEEYGKLINKKDGKPIIATLCPVIIYYVEKYHPRLIDNLAPIVSPMIAMGRAIKRKLKPRSKVVYIGPCIAKKQEIKSEKVAGDIDAVLTYAELKEMLAAKGIEPLNEGKSPFFGPQPYLGRLFPLMEGFLKTGSFSLEPVSCSIIIAQGKGRITEALQEYSHGNIGPTFIDLRLCPGCIAGPAMDNDVSFFKRREKIYDYWKEGNSSGTQIEEYRDINLKRGFTNRMVTLPRPTDEEIEGILKQIEKAGWEERLNCGACGYNSCRELAIAVHRGFAEVEMCWPYLLQRLETTQEELLRAERLTSLGQMAASIAHEINNPLSGVLVYTQLLSKKLAADSLSKEIALGYLSKMESEISRTSRIIRNLLDFARQTEPVLKLIDVHQVIEQALSLVGHQAALQNVKIVKEFDPSLPKIIADFDQLQQVFTNLALNAIQAMPQGGVLTLRTTLTEGEWVEVKIEDTGCGIPKENMNKLFTPFFTTKEKGRGVGLGLAVVHGIIQRHKGKIEVQSEVGKGTTFTLYLQVKDETRD